MAGSGSGRDPETQRLVRESLALVIRSEKVLTQLEDHVNLLRTFVHVQGNENGEAKHDDAGT